MLWKLKNPIRFWILFAALLLFTSTAASAEQDGRHHDLLRNAIEAAGRGECPETLMTPLLIGACEDQQPGIGQRISSLGKIRKLRFMGIQNSQMGPAEVYRVTHERGTMTWMINTDGNGKILVFYTPG